MVGQDVSDEELWRRCRQIAARLPLPQPFEIPVFVDALARQRGRAIELLPLPTDVGTPCGILLSTDSADYIGLAADTTPLHQQHILLHEVGHLMCGHTASGGPDSLATAAARLLPDLPPDLVRRVLGRTTYTELQEREAELIASLALHRSGRSGGAPRTTGANVAGSVARLGSLFGAPERRGRTGG